MFIFVCHFFHNIHTTCYENAIFMQSKLSRWYQNKLSSMAFHRLNENCKTLILTGNRKNAINICIVVDRPYLRTTSRTFCKHVYLLHTLCDFQNINSKFQFFFVREICPLHILHLQEQHEQINYIAFRIKYFHLFAMCAYQFRYYNATQLEWRCHTIFNREN